jgi:hypothetical protein
MDADDLAASFRTYDGEESVNVADALLVLARAVRHAASADAICPETRSYITITEAVYMVAKEIGRVADALQTLAEARTTPGLR